jgi:hypothetical protein
MCDKYNCEYRIDCNNISLSQRYEKPIPGNKTGSTYISFPKKYIDELMKVAGKREENENNG